MDPRSFIGKVIGGKYEVLAVLGEGGMGVVFKVRHNMLEKRNLFALKILHPRFSGDEHFRQRFLREVEVAMALTHENIVQIREFGVTDDDLLYFTMDFFPGKPLSDAIVEQGRFAPRRVAQLARALLLALAEAHRRGVVHRDLKPENILLSSTPTGDRVRILDFGIAKVLEGDSQSSSLTGDGIIGTPKYMSPEQASGEPVDGRSDLYSFGVVLYEMLTGHVPFDKGTARSILLAHMTVAPPPFREIAPELRVPPRLEDFVFRLLAKEPKRRPASADACIALLDGQKPTAPRRFPVGSVALFIVIAGALAGAFQLGYLGPLPEGLAESIGFGRAAPAGRDAAETRRGGAAEPATEASPTGAPEAGDEPPPAPRPAPAVRRFQCLLCGESFRDAEMPFNRHHGEPMIELTDD